MSEKPRYFALVVKVPAGGELGDVFSASTVIGEKFRWMLPAGLPEGTRITRSIELTEEFANRTW